MLMAIATINFEGLRHFSLAEELHIQSLLDFAIVEVAQKDHLLLPVIDYSIQIVHHPKLDLYFIQKDLHHLWLKSHFNQKVLRLEQVLQLTISLQKVLLTFVVKHLQKDLPLRLELQYYSNFQIDLLLAMFDSMLVLQIGRLQCLVVLSMLLHQIALHLEQGLLLLQISSFVNLQLLTLGEQRYSSWDQKDR